MMGAAAFLHERLYRSDEAMRKFREANVTLCGAGALGANTAENLARAGFTRLRIIDRDRVEEQNISTQPYHRSDIGAFKAKIMANTLYRALGISADARIDELKPENAGKLLDKSDLVVDLFDNSVARKAVKEYCEARGLACLHAGLADGYAEVIWNERYRVPSATQDDLCDYPMARNLVMITVAVTCEAIMRYITDGERQSFMVTLSDLTVSSY